MLIEQSHRNTLTMAFQPQEPALKQLAGFLKDSLSGYDRERQKNAEQVCTYANASIAERLSHTPDWMADLV